MLLPCSAGVGSWLFASLSDSVRRDPSLARVTLVARGALLTRVRTHGLEYAVRKADDAEEGVIDSVVLAPSEIRVEPSCEALKEKGDLADYVILCVKTWQVAQAAQDAAAILAPSTGCIVTTQNGVSAPTDASSACTEASVVVGIAKVIAFREDSADGPVQCVRLGAPSPSVVMLGEFGGACESDRVLRLRDILRTSGIEVPVPEDGNIKRELWRKATMMCCMGPMSAVTRADIYTMLKTPASRAMLLAAMEEVCALSARFEDCYVGDGWALQTMTYLEKILPGSTPSTVRDVVCGRPSEVREMSGAMHRLGLQQVAHALAIPSNFPPPRAPFCRCCPSLSPRSHSLSQRTQLSYPIICNHCRTLPRQFTRSSQRHSSRKKHGRGARRPTRLTASQGASQILSRSLPCSLFPQIPSTLLQYVLCQNAGTTLIKVGGQVRIRFGGKAELVVACELCTCNRPPCRLTRRASSM